MDYDNIKDYNQMMDSGDKMYNKAMMMICEKRYIEARAYFSDAISFFLRAENIAIELKINGLITNAKNKKKKAEQEKEGAIDLYYEYGCEKEEREM